MLEESFKYSLENNSKVKELSIENFENTVYSVKEKKEIIYKKAYEKNKIMLASFSSFSNINNKKKYINIYENNKNVDLSFIRDIINEENNLKNKNNFYTINSKLLVLSDLRFKNLI